MSFGLTNAPATFQRLMSGMFRNELFQILLCYLDDILVFGETIQRSLDRLDLVLTKLRLNGLKLEPKKCEFSSQRKEWPPTQRRSKW